MKMDKNKVISLGDNISELNNIIRKHINLVKQEEAEQVCSPLKKLGIHYFLYVRAFDDQSRIQISTNNYWSEHFYEKKFYKIGTFENLDVQSGLYLWSSLPCQQIFCDLRNYFQIDHGITLAEKTNDGVEYFHFGSFVGNYEINNFYINNIDLLKRFNLYFKTNAKKLIENASKIRVLYKNPKNTNEFENTSSLEQQELRSRFIAHTPLNKIPINTNKLKFTLTQKELECSKLFIQGYSAKQIANIMNISCRTAEEHLANLKTKFSCSKESQLGYMLAKQLPSNILM